MNISIIIPTLNEEDRIAHLLEDIKDQSLKGEVIVVDGKSVDKTIDQVKKFKSVKYYSARPQVAKQRNFGVKKATGDILIFLDADVRLPKNFLQKAVEEFKVRGLDIACPFYLPHTYSWIITSMYLFFNLMFFIFQKISPSGAGSCIICKTSVFLSDSGFKEEFRYDDIEMIRRYARKSYFGMLKKIIYVSDRRFRREGVAFLFSKYLLLSLLFTTNQFRLANFISYKFSHYKRDN